MTKPKPIPKLTEKQLESFWKNVEKTDTCWLYNGYLTSRGYGLTTRVIKGERFHILAHRLTLKLSTGLDPLDKCACHKPIVCHNTACCNPDHLYWGTRSDNMKDMVSDGTCYFKNRPPLKGTSNPVNKLSEEQVLEIYKSGKKQVELAREFGISSAMVRLIKTGKKWKWLTNP